MFFPLEKEYCRMAEEYTLIPVYTELMVDMETPISIYSKVCQGQQGFLLESVEGGERLARYSFIGFDPFLQFTGKGGFSCIRGDGVEEEAEEPPLDRMEKLMQSFKAPMIEGLPRFYGGAVGYFGFDLVRGLETLPELKNEDVPLNDCHFIFTRYVLVFDHLHHKLKLICNVIPGISPEQDYQAAIERLREIKQRITIGPARLDSFPENVSPSEEGLGYVQSNVSKDTFCGMVEQAKEYIRAGDIFQVVLSQRFSVGLKTHPFNLYRTIRTINPAPYMYYLDFDVIKVIGSSPEMLVRVEDGLVETCPIAGTRPRGGTPQEDLELATELLQDMKEVAEHLMLVDLGRNDLGRVCKCGTIEVSDFMSVQRYSHVMHLVTSVKGKLVEGKTAFDALKACFPAGTLTGAPKIRAMEIIEELEPVKRGIYGGAIGYLSFTGNIDTCITIRTILVKDGQAYVQAGAGIVADSDPEREYQETINKAKALIETLKVTSC